MNRLKALCQLVLVALLLAVSHVSNGAPLGTSFTYQGALLSGSGPANGNYDMTFALFNDPIVGAQVGTTWTNLNVTVSNGLFTTTVDFGSGVFDGTAYWLAIGVRSNGLAVVFSTLSPRQSVTPAPYALYATVAPIPDGSITSAKILDGTIINADLANNSVNSAKIVDLSVGTVDLADNSVTSAKILDGAIINADLANNSVNSAKIVDLSIATVDLADSSVTSLKILDGTIIGPDIANNAVTSVQLADSIGLGAAGVAGQLDVYSTSPGTPSISLFGAANQISTYGDDGLEQIRLWGPSWGEIYLFDSTTNNRIAVTLSANSSSGGYLALQNTNASNRALLQGLNSGGALTLYQADGGIGVFIDGESSGAGYLDLRSTNGSARVVLDADAGDGGGIIYVRNSTGANRVILDGQSTASAGEISLLGASGIETMQILGAETSTTGAELRLRTAAGQTTIELDGEFGTTGDSGAILLSKINGTSTIQLYADFAGTGDGRIVTQELQITGGSDLSEQFDINRNQAAPEAPEAGMVVCIDPLHPGQLMPSARPYDRTVAGVISGAGGVKPGMLMGQKGTKADGQHPVALTGRVYVQADASNGAIEPGDLLTSSSIPGHAMKVTDHVRAQGAILGKAMTALSDGKGTVLVLVSLQ